MMTETQEVNRQEAMLLLFFFAPCILMMMMFLTPGRCVYYQKTEKAESEAQRGKPKGTLESESRNAIV